MKIMTRLKKCMAGFLMAVMLCGGLTAGIFAAKPMVVQAGWFGTAGEDDNPSDYSFYNLSSSAAAALCSAAGTNDPDLKWRDVFPDMHASAAGGFLGFADERKGRFIVGFVQAMTSTSASTYTFKQMNHINMTTSGGNRVFLPYMSLGAAFADAGVDGYGMGAETFNMGRQVTGGLTMMLFISAQMIVSVYSMIIKLLQLLNPFQFFSAVHAGSMTGAFSDLQATRFGNISSTLTTFISGWYEALHNMSAVVCVFILGFFIVGIFLYRNKYRQWSTWRKLMIRFAFIFIGIPLIGGTYTSLLERLDSNLVNGNTAAVKVVASTFCDFEGFVMHNINSSMDRTVSVPIKATNSQVRFDNDSMSVQELCLALNETATGQSFSSPLVSGGASGDQSITQMVQSIQGVTNEYPDENLTVWVFDVLGRYMTSKKIRSSSFETAWVADHWGSDSVKDDLKAFIECSDSANDFADAPNYTGGARWTESGGINPFVVRGDNTSITYLNNSYERGIEIPASFKLSPMSVYNYLNTMFTSSEAVVYSTERASSDAVRMLHYSVNLAGGGIYGLLLFLSCVTLLGTYSIIGFFYSFGIFMTNIKRGVRLILAVPGAMLGSIQSIAKIISYAVLMVFEILLNVMCYSIFTELLFSISVAVMQNFTSMLAEVGLVLSSMYLMPIMSTLLICFLVWFCITAIKMRGVIVRSIEGMADNVVQKFIVGDTAIPASSSGGGAAALAGGATAGILTGLTSASPVGRHVVTQAQDTTKQEELISDMFNHGRNGGSAVNDELTMQQRKQIRSEERKEKTLAAFRMTKGTVDTAVGVSRTAGGDPGGILQAANGLNEVRAGGKQGMEASERAAGKRREVLGGNMPGNVPNTTTMGPDNKVSEKVQFSTGNKTVATAATTAATSAVQGGSKEQIVADVAKNVVKSQISGNSNSNSSTASMGGSTSNATAGSTAYQGTSAPKGGGTGTGGGGTYNGSRGGSAKGPDINVQGQTYNKRVEDNVIVTHSVNRTDKYVQGSQTTTGSPEVSTQSKVSNKSVTDRVNVNRNTVVNEYTDNPVIGGSLSDVAQPKANHRDVRVNDTVNVQRTKSVTETVMPSGPVNKDGFSKKS